MNDLTTAALVVFGLKHVGKPTADILTKLIERFLGPSVDVGGEALRDWMKARLHRGESVVREAVKMLDDAAPIPA